MVITPIPMIIFHWVYPQCGQVQSDCCMGIPHRLQGSILGAGFGAEVYAKPGI